MISYLSVCSTTLLQCASSPVLVWELKLKKGNFRKAWTYSAPLIYLWRGIGKNSRRSSLHWLSCLGCLCWRPVSWNGKELMQKKDESKKFSFLFLRMVQWCIRLTRLTLVCEVIRNRLVQIQQNLKNFSGWRREIAFQHPFSFILFFVLLPFFLNTKINHRKYQTLTKLHRKCVKLSYVKVCTK